MVFAYILRYRRSHDPAACRKFPLITFMEKFYEELFRARRAEESGFYESETLMEVVFMRPCIYSMLWYESLRIKKKAAGLILAAFFLFCLNTTLLFSQDDGSTKLTIDSEQGRGVERPNPSTKAQDSTLSDVEGSKGGSETVSGEPIVSEEAIGSMPANAELSVHRI